LQHHSHLSLLLQRILPYMVAILMSIILYSTVIAQITIHPVRWELPVVIPSPSGSNSWFPDLAVDGMGNVHIIWCETYSPFGTDYLDESIYYTMWNGKQWSQYIDIASPIREIRRNALAIDSQDRLHMSFIDSVGLHPYRLGYRSVQASQAFSANNWSPITRLNERGQSYMSEIVVHKDSVHVLYEDMGNHEGLCSDCADIFFAVLWMVAVIGILR
jgi:hypothetical protein